MKNGIMSSAAGQHWIPGGVHGSQPSTWTGESHWSRSPGMRPVGRQRRQDVCWRSSDWSHAPGTWFNWNVRYCRHRWGRDGWGADAVYWRRTRQGQWQGRWHCRWPAGRDQHLRQRAERLDCNHRPGSQKRLSACAGHVHGKNCRRPDRQRCYRHWRITDNQPAEYCWRQVLLHWRPYRGDPRSPPSW